MKLPALCTTMEEIRTEIDRVDAGLMAALAERARYIDRAAQIKTDIGLPARIPDRVEEVVANVGRLAVENGLPPEVYQKMWRDLIDWSIAREEQVLGKD
jgi:isochorismate pyruvate lyase